ncbi:DUF2283 domain-containing protein [Desulfurobacterium crinifex]
MVNFHYDETCDVVFFSWGNENDTYDGSEDFWDIKIILDFSTDNKVIGIEIFNWSKLKKYFSSEERKLVVIFDNGKVGRVEKFENGVLFLQDDNRPLRLELFKPDNELLKKLNVDRVVSRELE